MLEKFSRPRGISWRARGSKSVFRTEREAQRTCACDRSRPPTTPNELELSGILCVKVSKNPAKSRPDLEKFRAKWKIRLSLWTPRLRRISRENREILLSPDFRDLEKFSGQTLGRSYISGEGRVRVSKIFIFEILAKSRKIFWKFYFQKDHKDGIQRPRKTRSSWIAWKKVIPDPTLLTKFWPFKCEVKNFWSLENWMVQRPISKF